MTHKIIRSLIIVITCITMAKGWAAEGGRNWGLSPYLGLFNPSLKSLNKGEFLSPYEGTADLVDPFGNNNNVTVPYEFRAPMPELAPGHIGGLEFQWLVNDKHVLLIGAANWDATVSSSAQGVFPIQGAFQSVIAQRSGDLSFSEFYFGWRYNVIHEPKRHNYYFTLSLHDIFNVTYREQFSLLFLSGPPSSFRRSIVINTDATGLLLLHAGGGGEWFMTDWFSLGVEGGYEIGFKPLRFGNGNLVTDFSSNDNLYLEMPMIQNPASNNTQYKVAAGGQYRDLRLSFDGWKALVKATIYF
jgi:hypothetical protein